MAMTAAAALAVGLLQNENVRKGLLSKLGFASAFQQSSLGKLA